MSDFLIQFSPVLPDLLVPVLPEIFVLAMVSLILVVDAILGDSKRYVAYSLSLVTLAVAAFLTVRDFSGMPTCTWRPTPSRSRARSRSRCRKAWRRLTSR